MGLALRGFTVGFVPAGTSGRNTRRQQAATLNTTGMYSVTRNPLCFANSMIVLGLAAATEVWWFVLLAVLISWLFIERVIAAEEAFLSEKFGDGYDAWAARTPAFFPRWSQWRETEARFSSRTMVRREYNTLATTATAYLLLELALDLGLEGQAFAQWRQEDALWWWFFLIAAVIFVVLRTLKRHTRALDVPGRSSSTTSAR